MITPNWKIIALPMVALMSLLWLAGFVAIIAPVTQSAGAFNVNTTNDTHDAIPGNGQCKDVAGKCSLRAALEESNINPGSNQVNLPNGNYLISLDFLYITDTLTLTGDSITNTVVDGFVLFYIFNPSVDFTVTMSNLTIQNGTTAEGAGISNYESLILSNCIIQQTIYPPAGGVHGGAIFVDAGGSAIVQNCFFHGNLAWYGGAIYSGGNTTIINSTFHENIGLGGGIYSAGNTTIIGSTFYNNEGGAIYNTGALTVTSSTISGNTNLFSGGGIYSVSTPSQISFSTIVNNYADEDGNSDGDGGGIYSDGSLLIRDTIVANNLDGTGEAPDCGGALVSNGYNLIKTLTGCAVTLLPSDLFGLDPLLAPLAFNGGSTQTHALLPGSPALDTGICTDPEGNPVTADQRGFPRPIGPICDIGAYEYGFRLFLPVIIR